MPWDMRPGLLACLRRQAQGHQHSRATATMVGHCPDFVINLRLMVPGRMLHVYKLFALSLLCFQVGP